MKKMIMMVLVMALMVTSLAACGSKETVAESTETEVVATPEPTPEPTPTPTPEPTLEEIVEKELGIELQEGDVVKEFETIYEKGYEILHADGTATLDVEYLGDKHNMHLRVSHFNQDSSVRYNGKHWRRVSSIHLDEGGINRLEICVAPHTIDSLNLKELSDDEIGAIANNGYSPYYKLTRTETEDSYVTTCEFDFNIEGVPAYGYDKMINDYKTGKAYDISVYGTKKYFDLERAKKIVDSVQLFVETEDGEVVVIGGAELEQEVTVVETVELENKGATAVETRYSDGTSDYEVWHTNSINGASMHYKVKGIDSGATFYNADEGTQSMIQYVDVEDGEQIYKIYVCPQGDIESSRINLKNMTDEQVGDFAGSDYIIHERTETEHMATALVQYAKSNRTAYDYYVNDYTNGIAYWYMIHASEKYANMEFVQSLIDSIEILK